MKYTSASANKTIRALEEEKRHLLAGEAEACSYILSGGEKGDPPEYNYGFVRRRVSELDSSVRALRHALHSFNAVTVLPESGITIRPPKTSRVQLETAGACGAEVRFHAPSRAASPSGASARCRALRTRIGNGEIGVS